MARTLTPPGTGRIMLMYQDLAAWWEHVVGDMRSLRLGRRFDVVLVHDAIMYATEPAEVQATLRTAAAHCSARGTVQPKDADKKIKNAVAKLMKQFAKDRKSKS